MDLHIHNSAAPLLCIFPYTILSSDVSHYHSAGKRDRDPNPPPVVCSKVAEGGREL